ncbi:DUF6597 domain-containing transcriptional factor [Arcobacter sp. YIC-310]|uniref:DUF6597 domain-containing transcriptional factor n=1 Tax=Arcobacter sp. YIC-310 TaxID=3376632 RepID=UPI003C1F7E06
MSYFNKDLEDIGFMLYEPCKELEPYIYNYFTVKNIITSKKTNKILSDGSLGFTINFGNPYEITLNSKKIYCDAKVILNGQSKYPMFITFEKYLNAIGIRFKVGGAYKFFDEEISSLCDKNINYDESFWNFDILYKKLVNMNTHKQRIEEIERFLIKRLKASKKENSKYTFSIISFINEHKGNISIDCLCEEFALNKKQIERIFKKEVGLSAKLFTRIIRMRNVRDSLSSLDIENLTSTAYNNGFFDQAHFIKEFKSFMNETPKSYYKNKLSMAKALNFKKFEL